MARSILSEQHLLIIEDDSGHREFNLDAPVYLIGRCSQCNIRLDSPLASRLHAALIQLPNADGTYRYGILDGDSNGKGSTNGLVINGSRLEHCILQDGDEVFFGPPVRAVYSTAIYQTDTVRYLPYGGSIPTDVLDQTILSPSPMEYLMRLKLARVSSSER